MSTPQSFKFLAIADDSAEFAPALTFAAYRVKAVDGALVVLKVVDTTTDNAHWVSVSEEMRAEAMEAAVAAAERLSAEIWAETGVQPEVVIREGELRAELRRLIEQDRAIRMLVLGAGAGRDGPGPLAAAAASGRLWHSRAIPVIVVPGTLSKDEARSLASPGPAGATG